MVLSYEELLPLLGSVVVGADASRVNASSIDIALGATILIEDSNYTIPERVVYLADRQPLRMVEVDITKGYTLRPGQFVLAHSAETFNLPLHLSAEYKMKSSMARIGLNHLVACWCDAGWTGSKLTMELQNVTQHHYLHIKAGDLIGQMVFLRHKPVPVEQSYAARGRYNGDTTVRTIKP